MRLTWSATLLIAILAGCVRGEPRPMSEAPPDPIAGSSPAPSQDRPHGYEASMPRSAATTATVCSSRGSRAAASARTLYVSDPAVATALEGKLRAREDDSFPQSNELATNMKHAGDRKFRITASLGSALQSLGVNGEVARTTVLLVKGNDSAQIDSTDGSHAYRRWMDDQVFGAFYVRALGAEYEFLLDLDGGEPAPFRFNHLAKEKSFILREDAKPMSLDEEAGTRKE